MKMKVNTKQSHKGPVQIYHKNNHSVTSALAVKARKNYVGPNYSFTDLSLSCILSYPKVFRGDYQRYLALALTLLGEPSKPKNHKKWKKSKRGAGISSVDQRVHNSKCGLYDKRGEGGHIFIFFSNSNAHFRYYFS